MPEKILTWRTWPAMTAWDTPADLSSLMHLPSCPSETQCSAAPALPGSLLQVGEGLLLDGDDGDLVTEIAGALQCEKRKLAVAGDEADARH